MRKRGSAHERREEALLRLPVLAAAAMAVPTAAATGVTLALALAVPAGSPRTEAVAAVAVSVAVARPATVLSAVAEALAAPTLTLMHRELGNRPRRWLAALDFGQLGADQRPMRRPEVVGLRRLVRGRVCRSSSRVARRFSRRGQRARSWMDSSARVALRSRRLTLRRRARQFRPSSCVVALWRPCRHAPRRTSHNASAGLTDQRGRQWRDW